MTPSMRENLQVRYSVALGRLPKKIKMVQRTGFEPAKHYALGPHPSPFDHSGTSALGLSDNPIVFQNPGSNVQ